MGRIWVLMKIRRISGRGKYSRSVGNAKVVRTDEHLYEELKRTCEAGICHSITVKAIFPTMCPQSLNLFNI